MRAKICGITNLNDAIVAIKRGAWALGFNFYEQSPRYIRPDIARHIIEQLPDSIIKIGIFIGCSDEGIERIVNAIGLDLAQIYKDKQDRGHRLKKRMILSLQLDSEEELPAPQVLASYEIILLDASGGTGRLSNWVLAANLAKRYKLILAGGLTVDNIEAAIKTVKPYAVDVASGLESVPGVKDKKLIKKFLERCQHE